MGWTCHAAGMLGQHRARPDEAGLGGTWPPAARPYRYEIEDLYQRAALSGYEYGPSFQGLRAVWRHGSDLLAEVALPEAAGERAGFDIHPALLDAALHPALLIDRPSTDPDVRVRLPFAWTGVSLWATDATTVRVRLSPHQPPGSGEPASRGALCNTTSTRVLSADSVVLRQADTDQLRSADGRGVDGLLTLRWRPLHGSAPGGAGHADWVTLGEGKPGWAGEDRGAAPRSCRLAGSDGGRYRPGPVRRIRRPAGRVRCARCG